MKFADIVAVIIDDIDNDCFLMMMMISWLFNISRYAVFSFSPAPPSTSEAKRSFRGTPQLLSCAARPFMVSVG